jgi:hypothetical protein
MTQQKRKARFFLWHQYWWNPFLYIMIITQFFFCLWDGGIKEWIIETDELFKETTWR